MNHVKNDFKDSMGGLTFFQQNGGDDRGCDSQGNIANTYLCEEQIDKEGILRLPEASKKITDRQLENPRSSSPS